MAAFEGRRKLAAYLIANVDQQLKANLLEVTVES
jgi:hypothetical protein